ncbi:MAG TPA: ATP-binding protein [Bosea sp. (in: a-proteobacteria)]|uniref:ATP-binding protein n=1 Tax=Bosea sp. (in: a-proteobacteria) TaxID=1871050 RepID=UPI002E10E1EA|nr:ATP-binding protein [Bosea sp. (in: a-proteobacteria)]
MKSRFDTIQLRTVAVLLFGLGLFHLASLWTYQVGLRSELDLNNESRLAERLVSIKRAVLALPATEREAIAHSLSDGAVEVHWSSVSLASSSRQADPSIGALRDRLLSLEPELAGQQLIVSAPPATGGGIDPHRIDVSIHGADEGWLNISVTRLAGPHGTMHGVIWSTTLMGLGVVLIAILMVRWLTRPLRVLGVAAKRSYSGAEPVEVALDGPREIRELALAFNDMQRRIKRLVDDRTQTLAAVSHDLKTPLTRLRLRAAELGPHSSADDIEADLDEMEAMLDASLMFLKGEQVDEPSRTIDLPALLQTIRDDLIDAGHDVSLSAPACLPFNGRHLPLKRAFTNLIWNAVRYGSRARMALIAEDVAVILTIDDDGPGIAANEIESVFAPFKRLDTSRNRETGGVGLGLTIARTVIRGHGGEVSLENRAGGGLRAIVRLPRPL